MNINAGLKKLDEISGNVDGKCWSPTAYALRQILEAIKEPVKTASPEERTRFNIEQRLQHLEKLEDYVKELKERIERLEEQAKIAGKIIFKPSAPEKPDTILIPRTLACKWCAEQRTGTEPWCEVQDELYYAIKQALKGA